MCIGSMYVSFFCSKDFGWYNEHEVFAAIDWATVERLKESLCVCVSEVLLTLPSLFSHRKLSSCCCIFLVQTRQIKPDSSMLATYLPIKAFDASSGTPNSFISCRLSTMTLAVAPIGRVENVHCVNSIHTFPSLSFLALECRPHTDVVVENAEFQHPPPICCNRDEVVQYPQFLEDSLELGHVG